MDYSIEMEVWEIENMNNIIGWDICNAEQVSKGEWKYFDGYSIIIFYLKDKTQKQFKRINHGSIV